MPISEAAGLILLAAVTAIITTIVGATVGRKLGLGKMAEVADTQTGKAIAALKTRLELAETRAIEADAKATRTEQRRQACEEEIGRLNRRLLLTEGELLDLYRRTGERPPRDLVQRHRDQMEP